MRRSFSDATLTTMFLLLLLLDAGLAQTYTYGPAAPTSIRETRTVLLNYTSSGDFFASPDTTGRYRLENRMEGGGNSWVSFFGAEWDIGSAIPPGSTLTRVTFSVRYKHDSLHTFHSDVKMMAASVPLSWYNAYFLNTRVQTADWLYHNCKRPYDGYPMETDQNNVYSITQIPDPLPNSTCDLSAFQDSLLQSGRIVLGLQAKPHFSEYRIHPNDILLTIEFLPPAGDMIEGIRITNVVHAIEDYRLEPESRVRADLNVFLSGTVDPDYSAMPHYEPPFASRGWLTWRNHDVETWWTAYDNTPDGKREKHKHWDVGLHEHRPRQRDYKVLFAKTYEAIAGDVDSVFIRTTQEIYHPKDNMAFDFADPWRVIQFTDSSQHPEVGFIEHTTPYVPWNDPATLGVFLGMDYNYQHLPYYRIQPQSYLDYKESTDAYQKRIALPDALPLKEGDGLFMGLYSGLYGLRAHPSLSMAFEPTASTDPMAQQYRVRFDQSGSTTFLRYKAHLLSDEEEQPTARCSQRRLDIDDQNVYHLVYPSAGEIWYTQSRDSGRTWTPEELVSTFRDAAQRPPMADAAYHPSIAVIDSTVYVVYVDAGNIEVRIRSNGLWGDAPIPQNSLTRGVSTHPVIDAGYGLDNPNSNPRGRIFVVVWEGDEMLHAVHGLAEWTTDHYTTTHEDLVQSPGAQPRFPSIVSMRDFIGYGVSYTIANRVEYTHMTIWTVGATKTFVTIDPVEVVSAPDENVVFASSITSNHLHAPVLAYEVSQPFGGGYFANRYVVLKTRSLTSPFTWNQTAYQIAAFVTTYGDALNPTLGSIDDSLLALRCAFHEDHGGSIVCMAIDDGGFSSSPQITDASYPTMLQHAPATMMLEAYSAPLQRAPFSHAVRTTAASLAKTADDRHQEIRDLRVVSGVHVAACGVTDLTLVHGASGEQHLSWAGAADSAVIGRDVVAEAKMTTTTFVVASSDSLRFSRIMYSNAPDSLPPGMRFTVNLRDASSHTLLTTFNFPVRDLSKDSTHWVLNELPLHAWAGRTVYMTVDVAEEPANAEVLARRVFLARNEMAKRCVRTEASLRRDPVPVLSQNYPNPFNPATVIEFWLPEAGPVVLRVLDMTGREVCRLRDGYAEAGQHRVPVDGSTWSTGTYRYELLHGGRIMTQTMTLLK